jgi:hypothetical protein
MQQINELQLRHNCHLNEREPLIQRNATLSKKLQIQNNKALHLPKMKTEMSEYEGNAT